MSKRYVPAFTLALAVLVGCHGMAPPVADPARAEAAIRAADARWLAAAQAHDLEKTVSYWTDDVYMMPPGGPAMVGKDALRKYVAGAFAIPDFSISWVTDHIWVAKSGDVAYAVGTDTIHLATPEGKAVVEHNKAVAVWRKDPDGSWRCAVDIWNAAEPAP
ncbi:MAG TPA: SgcJ/EcaC family oxidoreductase [Steroidobacteraceae bacterium]|nr:SgcJ/EcaC family oxidoreductase [Steroidobacteraceae bacterium]